MDSLVTNYASSDDDDEEPRLQNPNATAKPSPPPPSKSLFDSLPPPKSSSSLFSSLPPPKTTPSSSIFSSLPPPKSGVQQKPLAPKSNNAKRVVHFTPPINPALLKSPDDDDDDDDDDGRKKEKKSVSDFSSKSLSAVIPPPKNSLCLAPAVSSSSARRSAVVADVPASGLEVLSAPVEERSNLGEYGDYCGSLGRGSEVEGQWGVDNAGGGGDVVSTSWGAGDGGYYENYGSYGGEWDYGSTTAVASESGAGDGGYYENYGRYGGELDYGCTTAVASETPAPPPEMQRVVGKRGRNEIPLDIVEVKQDELVKDRPREDQVKFTGIAFGPAYQAVSSQKGKPSKLHKRKHQISSLYFDMRQKEMELVERRAKGMLTKRETQGKYGW